MRAITRAAALFVSLAVFAPACVLTVDDGSTLTVANESSYTITELNLAPIDSTYWGPNLLGRDVMYPGEEIVLYDIECDTYDVQVIDEYGYPCVLESLHLCFDDELWVITNTDLSICDRFGSVHRDAAPQQEADGDATPSVSQNSSKLL